jgi:hypothetical protein
VIEFLYPCPKRDLIRSLAVGREDFSQLTKTERTKRRLRSVRDHRGFDLISAVLPFGRHRRDGSLALFILMIVGFALSLWPEKKTRPVDEDRL